MYVVYAYDPWNCYAAIVLPTTWDSIRRSEHRRGDATGVYACVVYGLRYGGPGSHHDLWCSIAVFRNLTWALHT